jgi:ankyrin repeat protein
MFDQPEDVKVLLRNGADANAKNGLALREAIISGHTEIAEMLLDHGAKIPDDNFETLTKAAVLGHFKTVRLVLERIAQAHNQAESVSAIYTELLEYQTAAKIRAALIRWSKRLKHQTNNTMKTISERDVLMFAIISGEIKSFKNLLTKTKNKLNL